MSSMEGVVVDCVSGTSTAGVLTDAQVQAVTEQQQQAQIQTQQSAAETAFAAQQHRALAAVSAALHGAGAAADAAALAGLVHKLTADPVQPLSAPELGMLLRFVLRCLLP
jgi:hypothetical protein